MTKSRFPHLGFALPHKGVGSTPAPTKDAIIAVARAAEEAGFHSGWVGDHIIYPAQTASRNASTRTGAYPLPFDIDQHDAFAVLVTAAAVTTRLRLGVGTAIAAYRPAPLLAKIVSSLDYLSDGRAILGLAGGWLEEEFDALGIPYAERLTRLEETISVCRVLWTEDSPGFEGQHFRFDNANFWPKPPQGRVPIWLGGHSRSAKRRAGRLGDGWYASQLLPAEIVDAQAVIDESRADAGRIEEAFAIGTSRGLAVEDEGDHLDLATSDPARIREELEAYAEVGTDLVVFIVKHHDVAPMLRAIDTVGGLGLGR